MKRFWMITILIGALSFGSVQGNPPLVRIYDKTLTLEDFQNEMAFAKEHVPESLKLAGLSEEEGMKIVFLASIGGRLLNELMAGYAEQRGLEPKQEEIAQFVAWAGEFEPKWVEQASTALVAWKVHKDLQQRYGGMVIKRDPRTIYPVPISAVRQWCRDALLSGDLTIFDDQMREGLEQVNPLFAMARGDDPITLPDAMIEEKSDPFSVAPWEAHVAVDALFEACDPRTVLLQQ